MIKQYVIQRRSWILFFLFIHFLFLLIAYIDPTIPFTATIYPVFLSLITFIIFFILRYHRETAFYKSMEEQDDTSNISWVKKADYPFEKIVQERVLQQMKQSTNDVVKYKYNLEQEKDELLSWIHEVKTPLTTMQLMVGRIDDESLKTKIMIEWMRIDHLLNQQLHEKRIPFIENDLHIEKVPLQPLIHGEIKNLQSWCFQKGIGFDLSLDIKEVLSDGKWLSFIVKQLITNAVKYSQKSEVTINSYLKDGQAILEVTDLGSGIDPKDLPRIFDKAFTSTADARNLNQSATGMGLYLAHKIAQALLIQIDVHSTLYESTTFTLTFPKKNEFMRITSM